MGPVDQLALGGHDEGQGHAGLAGALGARVRHGHGVHTSSSGCGRKSGGPRDAAGGEPWGGRNRTALGAEKIGGGLARCPELGPLPLGTAKEYLAETRSWPGGGLLSAAKHRWCSGRRKTQGCAASMKGLLPGFPRCSNPRAKNAPG